MNGSQLDSHQKGFGMIEVLIAVLVLAIGLLGMAALQTNGIKMTTGALSRTQAVLLTEDIIERARANRQNLSSYSVSSSTPPTCDPPYTYPDPDSTNSVASEDVAEWRNSVACLLPAGDSSVLINSNVMTVTVNWRARSGETSDGSVTVEAEI
ncbi:MAG: type IV pilus modification protein PilV [Oleiphilaceae bacterium]|nr:type IV pilus modification protein PilV [Oleiphilaceae bacterium]